MINDSELFFQRAQVTLLFYDDYLKKMIYCMCNNIKILDLGCGEGQWLFQKGGIQVVGTDISPLYLKSAIRKAKKGTHFLLSDTHYLPFKDKSFKFVHVADVLHHVSEFDIVLDEIARITSDRLEIIETVNDNILVRIYRMLIKNWKGMPIKSLFTSSQLKHKIKENFTIDNIEYYSYLPISYIFFYFGIKSRIMSMINRRYNGLLRKLKLDRYLVHKIQINCLQKRN